MMAVRNKRPPVDGTTIRDLTSEEVKEAEEQREAAPSKARKGATKLHIPELNMQVLETTVEGIEPLIVRAWDQKTMAQLADKAMGKAPKSRENVDPDETMNGARYISTDGWDGFPASAFKAAMVEAVSCLNLPVKDMNMKLAKKLFRVLPDGVCRVSGRQLVNIHNDDPKRFDLMQPTSGGGPYMSYRPRYLEWWVRLKIRFLANRIDAQGLLNLLAVAGECCGIGEHRPSAKESNTGSSGLFRIKV